MARAGGPRGIHRAVVEVLLDVVHELLAAVTKVELPDIGCRVLDELAVRLTQRVRRVPLEERNDLGEVRLGGTFL